MVWAFIRRWFGSGSDDDRDDIRQDMTEVRKQVLGERKRIDSVEDDVKNLENDIGENREAITHIIDILNAHIGGSKEFSGSNSVEKVKERVKGLEERLEVLERAASTADQTSGRTSKRLDDETTDQSSVEETAQEAVEGQDLWEKATQAQKRIIRSMFELGYPATYKEIASDVGKSVSTVKNHINNLKSIGFDFKEEEGPNNSKKYSLDERLRAFMTVRLND